MFELLVFKSEYDQETPQQQTADQPTSPLEGAKKWAFYLVVLYQ